jgi:hypothetical protein
MGNCRSFDTIGAKIFNLISLFYVLAFNNMIQIMLQIDHG